MKSITRYEAVELIIPANSGGTKFNFLDIPQLRSDVTKEVIVQGIKVFCAAEKTTDFNSNPVATMAQIQNAELTLYVDGNESIFRMPLTELMNSQNFANTFYSQIIPNEFDSLQVDWTKSYITADIPFNSAGANVLFSFLFGISYRIVKPGTMAAIRLARGDISNLPGQMMQ
jgi:hypothetical protein